MAEAFPKLFLSVQGHTDPGLATGLFYVVHTRHGIRICISLYCQGKGDQPIADNDPFLVAFVVWPVVVQAHDVAALILCFMLLNLKYRRAADAPTGSALSGSTKNKQQQASTCIGVQGSRGLDQSSNQLPVSRS